MTKKTLILALCLSSCSGLPSLDYLSAAQNSVAYISGKNNYAITRELYEQQEYSFIKVRVGRFEPLIMVLAYVNNGVYEWVGADNSKIYTYKGKIIELNGFENDIKIQFPHSKIKNFLTNSNTSYAVDFYSPVLFSLDVNTQINLDQQIVLIERLEQKDSFLRVQEVMDASLINWTKENQYFYDSDKRLFKTVQYVHPRLKAFEIEFYIK
jgi:hypothetical protein